MSSQSSIAPRAIEHDTPGGSVSSRTHPDVDSNVKHGPLYHDLLHFTPSLFSVNMGTGIVSILLYNFPYPADWLSRLGIVIFGFNIVLFVLISLATCARYIVFRGLFNQVNRHPQSGMFWGCLPMGFATITASPLITQRE